MKEEPKIEFDIPQGDFKGQTREPDLLKNISMQAAVMGESCQCGKPFGDHTVAELRACGRKQHEERLKKQREQL